MAQKPIRIKPANRGKLRSELGAKPGKKLTSSQLNKAKKSAAKKGNTAEMKRVTFAANARKWNRGKKK